ncbi:MAG: hypothetical protein ABL872_16880 [Lacibacter sp.]
MRRIAIYILFVFACSCNRGNYNIEGTVRSIEKGKDGYTAIIESKTGIKVSAVVSRVDMTFGYKELAVGDEVKIYGDSSNYKDEISIHVTKIVD